MKSKYQLGQMVEAKIKDETVAKVIEAIVYRKSGCSYMLSNAGEILESEIVQAYRPIATRGPRKRKTRSDKVDAKLVAKAPVKATMARGIDDQPYEAES